MIMNYSWSTNYVIFRFLTQTSYQISHTITQVTDATTQINRVRKNFNGPFGKKRISFCDKKFEIALTNFQRGWEVGQTKQLPNLIEMSRRTQNGFEAVRECENEWTKNGPRQKSPLTFYIFIFNKKYSIEKHVMNYNMDTKIRTTLQARQYKQITNDVNDTKKYMASGIVLASDDNPKKIVMSYTLTHARSAKGV